MNRVGGVLAVSRAIGDFSVRNSGLISVPTIKKRMLKASDKFIVIASDGVWDELSDQDAVNYCKEEFSSK
jgi:serine/threonine protein phosphatase PrpC